MPPTAVAPSPDDMKARKVELVLQQLDSLPTLPAIALRLLALTGDSESKIHEIVSLVSADLSLTGKLLSLVSSAAVGGVPAGRAGGGVTNLQQAVVLLGFDALRNLILSVKVFEVFQEPPDDDAEPGSSPKPRAFKRDEFWKHSLAVATLAELLAPRCKPKISHHDAFVCGLLHDIGKVAFDTAMPKSFARVVEAATLTRGDLADVERRIIGLDHALAGKRLAEAWNLPQLLTETIWLHGAPPPPPQAPATGPGSWKTPGLVNPAMVLLIGLCDLLVRRQHIGFSGNYLFPFEPDPFLPHLGLTAADVASATARLNEAVEVRARAIGLNPIESRELYLQSIANANVELGRANQQLALQNRKLAVRSTCFELLTAFYSRIVPAASPSQLLTDIGHVAHDFLESQRLVLFSQDPSVDETFAAEPAAAPASPVPHTGVGEVLLFDSASAMHDSFLMPMPRYAGDQRVGKPNQNFTRPALPQLEWLLERVHNFLGTRSCWFMPLLCGAQPVGGILWVAREKEENPANGGPSFPNSMAHVPDLPLVAQSWGMTLRTAQIREQQAVLTESLAAANRELGALQQQLVRAKSLASVGEMAAGAAHEMNNPLAIMCGRAQLLAARLADPALKQDASLIATQGERLSQIITDMMEFARPQTPRPAALNIDALVNEAVQSAADRAAMTPASIHIDLPSGGTPAVHADPRQIKNALVELLLNALQATKAVEGENRHAGPVQLQVRFDPLDQQLLFRVTDEGVGMTPDVMKNAFAPFFSAKSAGRNRGMGLAKALRWVENHNGTIRLDSQPNRGTTAILLLPAASQ
ncbi:MAG TPA: HDOD domain-containing protein [Phycisphaerae bacterium]|nr:HDOD domain-containing protein [Phycisphaerae bacterium]